MIGVEEQRAVAQLTTEHPVLVERRPVEGPEVVLRIDLFAVFAPDLPRPGVVELPPFAPGFRRGRFAASGAIGLLPLVRHPFIGVDCPRQFLCGDPAPQRIVGATRPLAGRRNRALLPLARPVVFLRIRHRIRPHRRADESALLLSNWHSVHSFQTTTPGRIPGHVHDSNLVDNSGIPQLLNTRVNV